MQLKKNNNNNNSNKKILKKDNSTSYKLNFFKFRNFTGTSNYYGILANNHT